MEVGSTQVRLRGLPSPRIGKAPRLREKLVTMPAAEKKISSWNQAGLTRSRIIMACLGLTHPADGPGVVPGPSATRNHFPLWLCLDALPKISLQPYEHPNARHERSDFPLSPLMRPASSPPLAQSFSGVWDGKSRKAPIFLQADFRYKST